MKHANFATYRDMSNEVYTEADMARMATRIWNGQRRSGINRQGRTKWCDATAVGINMRKAWFVDTIANWQHLLVREWLNVGDFEIKIDTSCRGDYPGRIFVRRPTEDSR